MNNIFFSYVAIIISTFLNGVGAILLKKGILEKNLSDKRFNHNLRKVLFSLVKSRFIQIGLFLYIIATIFVIFAMRFLPLSIVYPLSSISYIWVLILSRLVLKERVDYKQFFGIIFILLGISLLTL